jgi:hypothetical protein
MHQAGFYGLSDHLEALSKHGDPLEVLAATVDFEHFRVVDGGVGKGGLDRVREALQPVDDGDEDIFHAPVPELDASIYLARP